MIKALIACPSFLLVYYLWHLRMSFLDYVMLLDYGLLAFLRFCTVVWELLRFGEFEPERAFDRIYLCCGLDVLTSLSAKCASL